MNHKPLLAALSFALLAGCNVSGPVALAADAPRVLPQAGSTTSFLNPVKSLWTDLSGNPVSIESPDPWLTYFNGYYYLTTTTVNNIQVRRARSLADLTTAQDVNVWTDTDNSRNKNIWAAEFFRLNGPSGVRWYMYYTADDGNDANHRMFVLESTGDDPMGPYVYKGRLQTDPNNQFWAIDGTAFQHSSGQLYFLWSGRINSGDQKIYIAKMSNPWTLSTSYNEISAPTAAWERHGGNVNEGPEVLERNGKVFVSFSASSCFDPNYSLGLLTANSNANLLSKSSWTKSGGPVFQTNTGNSVYGPGHNGFFKSPDGTEDWLVYHATVGNVGGCGGPRTTRVQKITWNSDGSPNFGTPQKLTTSLNLPSGDPGPALNHLDNADFDAQGPTQTPSSWQTWGGNNGTDFDADYTEGKGFNGENRLTHYKSSPYQVYTSQNQSVPNGIYTLEGWVLSSGGQTDSFLSVKNHGGVELKGQITGDNNDSHWRKVTIPNINVTTGTLTVGVYSLANAGNWLSVDRLRLTRQSSGNLLLNPGFEANADTQTPSNWQTWAGNSGGDGNADFTESFGDHKSGSKHLTHHKSSAYQVYTSQTVTGLSNGLYTARAWVQSSGGQGATHMDVKGYGGSDLKMPFPQTGTGSYRLISIPDVNVTSGQATVGFYSQANAGNWLRVDDVEFFKQ